MNDHSLMRFYRQLLFHEKGNHALRTSIRDAMRQIRNHGLDDVDALLSLMRKQCRLIHAQLPRTKLLRKIRALRTMATFSSSSSSSSSIEEESENENVATSSEDDENDGSSKTPRYKVDSIKGFRLQGKASTRMYLVRWKGYDSEDDTWEPVDRLMEDQCGDLVARFHREHMRFF
jgi:hypothetical protein